MYPWYRDTQIGVGQFCSPATIKTETGYNDCMLTFDYTAAASASVASQSKVSSDWVWSQTVYFLKFMNLQNKIHTKIYYIVKNKKMEKNTRHFEIDRSTKYSVFKICISDTRECV